MTISMVAQAWELWLKHYDIIFSKYSAYMTLQRAALVTGLNVRNGFTCRQKPCDL